MRANISAVNLYLECPRKWYWKYVLKRGLEARSEALELGTLWHEVCAGTKPLPIDAPNWMGAAHEALLAWEAAHPDVRTLANELTLEAPLGQNHTIFGRLDRLVAWNGKLWHWQHKTLAGTTPLDVYKRMVARSFHEHAYQHLIERMVVLDETLETRVYGGTILAIARKVNTAVPFVVEYLDISQNHEEMLRMLEQIIEKMMLSHVNSKIYNVLPWQNPNACGGQYKNHLCDYVDVCDGRSSIGALPQINPLAGYEGSEKNAG